jgi:hypothetical protein
MDAGHVLIMCWRTGAGVETTSGQLRAPAVCIVYNRQGILMVHESHI